MAKKRYTIDGISISLDERVFKDYRLLELQVEISSPEPDADDPEYAQIMASRGAATIKFINMVLGSEKDKVTEAIAKKNDGYCDVETLSNWVVKLFNKVNTAKK